MDNFYFMDMDGVIAKYDRHAYDRDNGPAPGVALFEHHASHYFALCDPDPVGIAIMDTLNLVSNGNLIILSSVAKHIPWAADDKRLWLERHCPRIDPQKQLVITNMRKSEAAKLWLGIDALDHSAILIDDFNPNLIDWTNAGGKAIKYLNGINDPESWRGPCFDSLAYK